ncbi:MAG TPA: ADP-ribosylation factor-like protein [Candidatus Bathyarchaeia archaeon]|nr:ADP-ribosylation factor-like protein [Candidatus Bathyarchaeia archaeon]
MSFSEDEETKILIAGLPGSGLKTIKAVVVDNLPPKELKEVVQKLDVGNALRDLLQRRTLLIRCGGDKSIQDIISRDNDSIYEHVEALLFVIDINDQSNFSIAKYWFDTLVKHLHKFSKDARIFLLLNKIDLLSNKQNIAEYLNATKSLFTTDGLDIYIHETSIYDASVFYAFKDALRKEFDNQISIKQYLSRVIKDSSFTALAVYSKDGLPIYDAGTLTPIVEIAANIMLSTVGRISGELDQDDEVSSTILQMKKNTFMIFKAIDKNSIFVGMSVRRPKLGQMLVESDQIVDVLQKAIQ